MTKTQEKAVEIMERLGIYKPYIAGFKKKGNVCYFENFGGFWAYQDEELQNKICEIQNRYNITVYAVTHDITEFGELYSLLYVSNDEDEWKYAFEEYDKNKYYVNSYTWNKTDDWCSEFGDIVVTSFGGGIKRIG